MSHNILKDLILLGGIGHILLSMGSLLIPKILKWNVHLATLQPLLRQMFWTYAAYIFVINMCFGIVSLLGVNELLDRTFLAKSLTLFIALYWATRIGIQFFYFDKSNAPKGIIFTLAEIALVLLFFIFTIIYGLAFFYNLTWI